MALLGGDMTGSWFPTEAPQVQAGVGKAPRGPWCATGQDGGTGRRGGA